MNKVSYLAVLVAMLIVIAHSFRRYYLFYGVFYLAQCFKVSSVAKRRIRDQKRPFSLLLHPIRAQYAQSP